jgi:hypothetical protein
MINDYQGIAGRASLARNDRERSTLGLTKKTFGSVISNEVRNLICSVGPTVGV